RVEAAGEQDVRSDASEPLRFLDDHLEQALLARIVQILASLPQRLSRPVDRSERSTQLVRHGRHELALELVERPLLGQAAERVDGSIRELDARAREPQPT